MENATEWKQGEMMNLYSSAYAQNFYFLRAKLLFNTMQGTWDVEMGFIFIKIYYPSFNFSFQICEQLTPFSWHYTHKLW